MIEDVIQVHDQFYILATSSRADERTRVLKHGETFAVFDHYGDIVPFGLGQQGIYHEGTRFISRLELRLEKIRPLLLSSTIRDDNDLLTVDLTNPDISINENFVLPHGMVHVFRSKFLWESTCYEQIQISNHGLHPAELSLSFRFAADFADIFEVRGLKREHRGTLLEPEIKDGSIVLRYEGLDRVVRSCKLLWDPSPGEATSSTAQYRFRLPPQGSSEVLLTICCESSEPPARVFRFQDALLQAKSSLDSAKAGRCEIYTSNEQFNEWIARSVADLHMMATELSTGPYPYAGVPWFSTVFGRDGIITAMELLWTDPSPARGVLRHLAATQACEQNHEQDAEPGKILHEMRRGEMAALGEVPFGKYYGSVDATPLFVILAGLYHERTADREFIESIWSNIERALNWIDEYGDRDHDGFVEYFRENPRGLVHQGWKDSHDPIFHSDGSPAEGPIALCEVQAYVYAARQHAARLAVILNRLDMAERLLHQAEQIKQAFEEHFWCEELSTYALALDGNKKPCKVRTSNAGHCLFGEIADEERARRAAETLFGSDSFSGWGIRTVAASEIRYNPMSYHNGSVWPHDNALIALGLSRYGLSGLAARVMAGIFDASIFVDLHRLPELFCGFQRRHGEGPTLYPVACAPQAWAAGSVFMFLQACLALSINAQQCEVTLRRPLLPVFLDTVRITNLQVGDSEVDLLVERHAYTVTVDVLRRKGALDIVIVK
ncbi:MAG: amylo-alpha-1,6-glucosidase [Acidobacteria bacterium]|nr:amylo-alpha-1,6-glucosidase [Acidobacteriota bacterium]